MKRPRRRLHAGDHVWSALTVIFPYILFHKEHGATKLADAHALFASQYRAVS